MNQIIRIKMAGKEIKVDLPEDKITTSSIKSAFLLSDDAVVSLSYEDHDGRQIGCKMNEAGTLFLLPDGWPTMQFIVKSNMSPRQSTSVDQTMNRRPINPYCPASPPKPAPTSEAFIKWMFFLYDNMRKDTTICIHPRFFVTFRHGTHAQYEIGDALTIYKAGEEMNKQLGVTVSVVKINEAFDFVLLKSESDVVDRGPPIVEARESEPFILAGFGNEQRSLSYLPGAIHSVCDFYSKFEGDPRSMGPFILGTSRSSGGDSVGGVWSSHGLIGMNIGCTKMPQKVHNSTISEAATFSPKNIISPALRFKEAYMNELYKERKNEKVPSPPPKKPYHMAEFAGIGNVYLHSS